ncbi:hypothetical protein DCE93_01240 [Agromyces badenianii]|uniref:Secreted protein n=1 Tax=Agromyces badenianii TaxID=2080742 RepID=A0A2S0WT25_9MICO|nr:hypothetical protein [Agromyces badenianii]AWB94462.1 hypothetical protein DCE93_01240 [Agromyces badenianii]
MAGYKTTLAVLVAAVAVFGMTGCSASTDELVGHFETSAEQAEYECVETVPSQGSILALRSCQNDDGSELQFAVFDSVTSQRSGSASLASGTNPVTVGHDVWAVAGEDSAVVQSIAAELGSTESELESAVE